MNISFIIIIISIIMGIASAVFSISTIIKTRAKYYQEFICRRKMSQTNKKQSNNIKNKEI